MVWFYLSYLRNDLLGKPVLHGSLLALIYLTRPELILIILTFCGLLGVQTLRRLLSKKSQARVSFLMQVGNFCLPIIVIAGGYHLFRLAYYGEFFPNTYYAKDGLGAYWSAGWLYLRHFCLYSPLIMLALVGVIVGLAFNKKVRENFRSKSQYKMMLLQASILVIYVVRLGGDFMAFRFFLPAMIIFVLVVEGMYQSIVRDETIKLYCALGLLVVAVLLVFFPFAVPQRDGYIADERQYYDFYHPPYRAFFEDPVEHHWYKYGLGFKVIQERTNYPISVGAGNIGYLGYAAGPKVYIVDILGLVDKQTARNWSVVKQRGRPGHDIKMTLEQAVERKVTFFGTPYSKWNSVMDVRIGTIISLDPAFVRNFPDKVAGLKKLKGDYAKSPKDDDGSGAFLKTLESKYQVSVDTL
jgi:hypothetical protein